MTIDRTVWTRVFLAKGAYNILLSLALLIWADTFLPMLGALAGNPVYAQLFLMLCLAFGVGYVLVGLDIESNHGVVVIGILGQGALFCVVVWQWMNGNVYPIALVSALIDLAFAAAFVRFLWRYDYNRAVRKPEK